MEQLSHSTQVANEHNEKNHLERWRDSLLGELTKMVCPSPSTSKSYFIMFEGYPLSSGQDSKSFPSSMSQSFRMAGASLLVVSVVRSGWILDKI